ncbi:MAG: glutamine synthetase [Candidatus Microthrix sp.]|nr:glutamine synthetase [Candidatus Microthrix sp.]
MTTDGPLDLETLALETAEGALDTVVVAFTDLSGRLLGKRVTARFFLDHVVDRGGRAGEGVEACNYLLTTDVEMNVVPGYRYATWEAGFGDFRATPDLKTLRRIPWLEATALVLCDLSDHDGNTVAVSPRQILKDQLKRAEAAGFSVMMGSELEFFLSPDTYEQVAENGFRAPRTAGWYNLDYHILQTSKDEPIIRRIRNEMLGANLPIEFSKGEAAPGQHEINLRYSDALEMADNHVVFKNGVKEIAHLEGQSATFMAKPFADQPGSSCHIHTSLWSLDGQTPLSPGDAGNGMSGEFRSFVAGLVNHLADVTLLGAPNINSYKRYQPESWAPTATVWALDNRTAGLRLVGTGPGLRIESRIPGADANPYLAFAGVIAAGLAGIEEGLDCGPPYDGNAYAAGAEGDTALTHVPWNLPDATEAFRNSEVAQKALGEDVMFHLAHGADEEWRAFHREVSDWEYRRGYERL